MTSFKLILLIGIVLQTTVSFNLDLMGRGNEGERLVHEGVIIVFLKKHISSFRNFVTLDMCSTFKNNAVTREVFYCFW